MAVMMAQKYASPLSQQSLEQVFEPVLKNRKPVIIQAIMSGVPKLYFPKKGIGAIIDTCICIKSDLQSVKQYQGHQFVLRNLIDCIF